MGNPPPMGKSLSRCCGIRYQIDTMEGWHGWDRSEFFPNLFSNFGVLPVSVWYRRRNSHSAGGFRRSSLAASTPGDGEGLDLLRKRYFVARLVGVRNHRTRHVRPSSSASNELPYCRTRIRRPMNVATLDTASIEFAPPTRSVARRLKYSLVTLLLLGSLTFALFLGWGWDDLLQLFSHPARATLLVALMIQLAFAVARSRPVASSGNRSSGRVSAVFFWLMVAAGLFVVASSAFWDRRILFVLPGDDLTRYAGLGLFLVGLAINAWPQNTIGMGQDDVSVAGRRWQRMMGRRAVGRRPVQIGLMMAVIGLPMVFLSQVGLAGSVCFVAAMTARSIWTAGVLDRREHCLAQRLQAA